MSAMGGRFDGLGVVDLFAGSGALGLECLSRGAAHCTFVERGRTALRTLEANVAALGAGERVHIVRADALGYVERLAAGAFDLALADPPYGRGFAARLVDVYRRTPFASELWLEHRSDEAIPDVAGISSRRYGDTTLTTLTCDPPSP
jgi:16S rRNA (guanine966-N2)-methyltransferase